MKIKIDKIEGRIILDSRQQETIEVSFYLGDFTVKASVPSGKSKGSLEVISVTPEEAVKNIAFLESRIIKEEFIDLKGFDKFLLELDGSKNKKNLGANVTLALSMAFARIWAEIEGQPLYVILGRMIGVRPNRFPKLFTNLIEGGLHAKPSLHPVPFQEYLVIPQESSPRKSLEMVAQFAKLLGEAVSHYQQLTQGDEGGFIISGDDPESDLKILQQVLSRVSFGMRMRLGLDVAASSLWSENDQTYNWRNYKWTSDNLLSVYQKFAQKYPLLSIEDPFNEKAWEDWSKINEVLGDKIWIVGDDLTVTNAGRIKEAAEKQAANAVIIKPTQIGTVSETLEAVVLAKRLGWKIIVSHRSGETDDDFIADLAYGVGADGLKAGSPLQRQRLVKYERLVQIEDSLNV